MDASHLIVDTGEAAFIDVGTNHSIPYLLKTLETRQIPKESVRYVILTHIHLDHAGGAGTLLAHLPEATLVVHPRGARHMVDPTRLWQGALEVYGAQEMERSYGTLLPIPEERVLALEDGAELSLGGRTLKFLHTEGHAKHHFCIWDSRSRAFFTGDTFGLSYREFDSVNGPFIFPTTTPIHFDPEAMHASIDRLSSFNPEAMYLTHFSYVKFSPKLTSMLHRQIDEYVELALRVRNSFNRVELLKRGITHKLLGHLEAHRNPVSLERTGQLLELDILLNALGLDAWLNQSSGDSEGTRR
jgi:glyoxylase-like metal-dependent hydrolase (beta-lactamase superfamily II)